MQAFLNRLRNQASSTRDSSSAIPSASTQAQSTPAGPETAPETTRPPPARAEQPTEATNAEASPLTRKIHPNLDELANQKDQQTQLAEGRWKPVSEFGQVPAALARVANRRVPDESMSKSGSPSVPPTSFSSDLQRHPERISLVRRASAPYLHSQDATWSTFGRKDSHPPVSLSRASSSPSRSRSRPPTVIQTPAGDNHSNNQVSPYVSAPESPVASIGIPYVSRESASNSSNNRNSSSPAVSNVTPDHKDTPARRSTKSSSEVQYPSLPSTFGRGSSRPAAGGIFHSEPTPVSSKPATRPTSAQSLRPSAEEDPRKAGIDTSEKKSSISKATGGIVQMSLHAPPRPTDGNIEGSSTGRPQTAGSDWMSNLSIKGILHFPSTTPNEAEKHARLEQAVRIRERRRTLSASSLVKRRSMSSSSSANTLAISGRKLKEKILIPTRTITQVFSVTTPKIPQLTVTSLPSSAQNQQQGTTPPVASTSTQPIATVAANPDNDQLFPPVLSVTAPTPSPSPSASRVHNNGLPATELGTLHVPPKLEKHVSHAAIGKRKAEDESETDHEGARRRWTDVPSAFPRKKMRLSESNESSPHRLPSTSLRGGRPTSVRSGSGPPSTIGAGSRSARMRNASQTSIPISAIFSPRPPSRHQQSSSSTAKGHNPLKNKYQELSWEESWHVSWADMSIHGWLFLAGFILPVFWWIGALLPLPPSDADGEPDWVAYEARWRARNWRKRCIIASVVSTVIYVPVITCAVIFSRPQSNSQHAPSYGFGNNR